MLGQVSKPSLNARIECEQENSSVSNESDKVFGLLRVHRNDV